MGVKNGAFGTIFHSQSFSFIFSCYNYSVNNKLNFEKIKFRKGIRGSDDILLEEKKQIAFYGRSNVGKSSSINTLLSRNSLVRSSATPGKTREINFFEIDEQIFFVDLPGYGYARTSKTEREKLRKLILWYVIFSDVRNRLNVIVIDARRGLSDFDKELINIFREQNEDIVLLINKMDKLNQKEKFKAEKEIQEEIGADLKIVFFSAKTGKGKDKFLELI